jgi:hypothetical protein
MVGHSKPHRTPDPPIGQLLCSLKSFQKSYCKHRLAGTQGAVLDLWGASFYGATQQLVWVLHVGHNQAILLFAPPQTR